MPGKYQSLYQYLENRYANTVVLTFAQIEDLLGFTLPDSARVDQEWWANNDPNDTPQPHSRSWTLASRRPFPCTWWKRHRDHIERSDRTLGGCDGGVPNWSRDARRRAG